MLRTGAAVLTPIRLWALAPTTVGYTSFVQHEDTGTSEQHWAVFCKPTFIIRHRFRPSIHSTSCNNILLGNWLGPIFLSTFCDDFIRFFFAMSCSFYRSNNAIIVACSTRLSTVTMCTKWRQLAMHTWWRVVYRLCTMDMLRKCHFLLSNFWIRSKLL